MRFVIGEGSGGNVSDDIDVDGARLVVMRDASGGGKSKVLA